jgi:hypothetical protein
MEENVNVNVSSMYPILGRVITLNVYLIVSVGDKKNTQNWLKFRYIGEIDLVDITYLQAEHFP